MTLESFSTSGPDREPIRKARSFNELRAARIGKAIPLPPQGEIDRMVAAALAKARARTSPAPEAASDPVETMIAKAKRGAVDPREIDAEIDGYVRKARAAEDRTTASAYERLAKAGDKELNRLYGARQLAAVTFRKNAAVARETEREAARAEVQRIEREIDRLAAELQRAHPGKYSRQQAVTRVLESDKALYSGYLAAKGKATQ